MRLKKKLCAIGLSCMLGVLCCVPASAAENTVSGGEMCGVCGMGNLVETDYEHRTYEYAKCALCQMDTVLLLYYERVHFFQCDYPYCGYMEDYSVPRYIEDVYPCLFCSEHED